MVLLASSQPTLPPDLEADSLTADNRSSGTTPKMPKAAILRVSGGN